MGNRPRIIIDTLRQIINVNQKPGQWLIYQLKKMLNSIAFYPALIAFLFLALSYFMIHLDFSDLGKQIKSQANWLRLKDASTARTIISVIAAGILSLTVFSFTMVMVILNQAASQMSNRVLDKLIGNRFQQVVLGTYIGTIVYSLFLLSAIRDIDSGIYVPSLSTYLLIAFAIIDIFFFIYFLHYITQSVKYAVIIHRIYKETHTALKETCRLSEEQDIISTAQGLPLHSPAAGVFNGFNKERLLSIAQEENCMVSFLYPQGSYVLEGAPILSVQTGEAGMSKKTERLILETIHINELQTLQTNFYYGFRQLTEVAIKALSPGINDPGTAVESLRSLASLLSYRLQYFPENNFQDKQGVTRIVTSEFSFEDIFNRTFLPIWEYGKNDLFIQEEMIHLLQQLLSQEKHPAINSMLLKIQRHVAGKMATTE